MSSDFWTDELEETAREMWHDRMSAKQIGEALGCTRNMVIGVARRRGWSRCDADGDMADIVQRVAEAFSASVTEICSYSLNPNAREAREFAAIYLSEKNHSVADIADRLGCTTSRVYRFRKQHTEALQTDWFREHIDIMRQRVEAPGSVARPQSKPKEAPARKRVSRKKSFQDNCKNRGCDNTRMTPYLECQDCKASKMPKRTRTNKELSVGAPIRRTA